MTEIANTPDPPLLRGHLQQLSNARGSWLWGDGGTDDGVGRQAIRFSGRRVGTRGPGDYGLVPGKSRGDPEVEAGRGASGGAAAGSLAVVLDVSRSDRAGGAGVRRVNPSLRRVAGIATVSYRTVPSSIGAPAHRVTGRPASRREQAAVYGRLARARSGSGSGSARCSAIAATQGSGRQWVRAPTRTRSRYQSWGRPSPSQPSRAR